MNRPLLALAGLIALGGVVAGVYIVAAPGGEEETVQQPLQELPTPTLPLESPLPTILPTIPAGWEVYVDPALGFSFPQPPGLVATERSYETHETDACPANQVSGTGFNDSDGIPIVGVGVAPNPCGLSVEEWIRTYPGWPCEPNGYPTCEPADVLVAGERGIRFSINVLGEPAANIYFGHDGLIFELSGNVFGSGHGGYSAAISEAEFQVIVEGFRFAP